MGRELTSGAVDHPPYSKSPGAQKGSRKQKKKEKRKAERRTKERSRTWYCPAEAVRMYMCVMLAWERRVCGWQQMCWPLSSRGTASFSTAFYERGLNSLTLRAHRVYLNGLTGYGGAARMPLSCRKLWHVRAASGLYDIIFITIYKYM